MRSTREILDSLGLSESNFGGFSDKWLGSGRQNSVFSPIDGQLVASVETATRDELETIIEQSHEAFFEWRAVPAPKRGAVVRDLGVEIEKNLEPLAQLVTLEMGKTIREARGEVQEMIDICEFALGQSRQLYGLTMPSERSGHQIQEKWHPLGPCAVVTAFNFPVAVWSWNTALALICGDPILWKPSSKTPLTAIACTKMAHKVLESHGYPKQVCSLVVGAGAEIGDALISDRRISLVSFTGSVERGRHVGQLVQERFGRHILELGGNNAIIVSDKADLDMSLRAVYFGAIGTTGQRCTSTRRVFIHESVYDRFLGALVKAYEKTTIGDPRDESILMGPLVSSDAVRTMNEALEQVEAQGGRIVYGGEDGGEGCYVKPHIAEVTNDMDIVKQETFAPILYVMKYKTLGEAITMQNDVPQGLSSAIMSEDLHESEIFLSAQGSDCGLANVNTGTSGAEIGGAFGGEKETGGGRESGSDAWKSYMRRQTSVINYSKGIELAQGIPLEI